MRRFAFAPLALLAACGPSENDPGPGGVTVGEAKALDEAAEMIEQRRRSSPATGQADAAAPDKDETQ